MQLIVNSLLEFCLCKNFRNRNAHTVCDTEYGHDSGILGAALDAAHIGAIYLASKRQFFL